MDYDWTGWQGYEPGVVRDIDPEQLPESTLVERFKNEDERPADAIVLRGYLGQSDFFKRTLDYLVRAKRAEQFERAKSLPATVNSLTRIVELVYGGAKWTDEPVSKAVEQLLVDCGAAEAHAAIEETGKKAGGKRAATGSAKAPSSAGGTTSAVEEITHLIQTLKGVKKDAVEHVPLRLYLTPSLDRFVDFHRSSVLAVRREPRTERRDTFTVWLRIFEEGSTVPVPYRVVHETILGPSFAGYLGGDLIDDYLGQPGSGSTAWGDQSSPFGGGGKTGRTCGLLGGGGPTGRTCGAW
jgi:hypothetical protein